MVRAIACKYRYVIDCEKETVWQLCVVWYIVMKWNLASMEGEWSGNSADGDGSGWTDVWHWAAGWSSKW